MSAPVAKHVPIKLARSPKKRERHDAPAPVVRPWIPKYLVSGGAAALGLGALLGAEVLMVLGGYAVGLGFVIAAMNLIRRWLQP
jgi:hypothetical protein